MLRHLPNSLTLARLVLAPVIFLLFILSAQFSTEKFSGLIFFLFLIASLFDFADGFFARRWKVESVFGAMLDPIADKLLVTLTLAGLMSLLMANSDHHAGWMILFAIFAAAIISRDLFISGLREYAALNQLKLAPSALAKCKTTAELLALLLLLWPWYHLYPFGIILLGIAAFLSILSAWQYVRMAVKPNAKMHNAKKEPEI